MQIIGYSVEKLEDPFGLLLGDRYEFFLDLDIEEDDELYSEKGIGLRVLFGVNQGDENIINYHFFEQGSDEVLDFALEDDEEVAVMQFCKEHLQ
nr:DUF6509 family protein [Bacillus rubiinfantis]